MPKLNVKTIFASLLLFVIGVFAGVSSAAAQQTIQTQQIASGLPLPNYVTFPKDDSQRLFIVLKAGVIRVLNPATGATSDFLDITSRVLASTSISGERGLLGMAFHPQYASNRRFFVYYTRQPDGAIQIAEYKTSATNPNVADPTEKIIITVPHPNFSNHNGGMVEFGPDGYLYFAPGDGGSANDPNGNAQNINVLLGKMIRIDVNVPETANPPYAIPPDNPFAGATPGADEIYAYGLRNPFRFSFDRRGTRQLYIGDVGQNQIEEIDIGRLGANYGWRAYEGTQCTGLDPQLCVGGSSPINQTPPIFEYTHTGGRCSITGGYVYRGRRGTFPDGAYIYADYCTGEIWQLVNGVNTLVLDTPFLISSFGEDDAGEIYITTNNANAGTVQRLVNPNAPTPKNTVSDFDGDLRTDISVFRPSTGIWYFYDSLNAGGNSGYIRAIQFGSSSDLLAPGDFDGDGKADVAVFRPNGGFWYSLDSSTGAFRAIQFGASGDIPVPGDYDGDRKSDYAVFRPSNSTWYIINSSNNSFRAQQWGTTGDIIAPADYDGDGKTDVAVVRPGSQFAWYILQSSNNAFRGIAWGASGDVPVAGDYDGDGKTDVAVFRPNGGFWYALQSSNNGLYARQWGTAGDTPTPGDYDGDGLTDPTITRNIGGLKNWFILRSNTAQNATAFRQFQFGINTDREVVPNDVP